MSNLRSRSQMISGIVNIGSRGANVNAACSSNRFHTGREGKQPSVFQERQTSTTTSDRSTLRGIIFTDHEKAQPSEKQSVSQMTAQA